MILDAQSFLPSERFGDVREVVPISAGLSGASVYSVATSRGEFVLLHPYSDLATLSNFMNLPEDAAFALLAAQERTAIGAEQQHIFQLARERSRIVYGAVFLRMVPDLTGFALASREGVPTLAQCYQRMAEGALSPSTAEGQALIGAALLRQSE